MVGENSIQCALPICSTLQCAPRAPALAFTIRWRANIGSTLRQLSRTMLPEAIWYMLRQKFRKSSKRESDPQGTATLSPSPAKARRVLLGVGVSALLGGAIIGFVVSRTPSPVAEGSVSTASLYSRNTIWRRLQREIHGATQRASTHLADRFALFRRPTVAMPPKEANHVRQITGSPVDGLNLAEAHYLSARRHGLWIATGKGVVCLAQAGQGSVACTTYTGLFRHGLVLGVVWPGKRPTDPPDKVIAIGLLPALERPTCVLTGTSEKFVKQVDSEVVWLEAHHLIHLRPCSPSPDR